MPGFEPNLLGNDRLQTLSWLRIGHHKKCSAIHEIFNDDVLNAVVIRWIIRSGNTVTLLLRFEKCVSRYEARVIATIPVRSVAQATWSVVNLDGWRSSWPGFSFTIRSYGIPARVSLSVQSNPRFQRSANRSRLSHTSRVNDETVWDMDKWWLAI